LAEIWTVNEVLSNYSDELASQPVFATVAKAARICGVEGYVVGGYVRDLILNRPNKDMDFVCVGGGIAWAEQVAVLLGNVPVTVFKNYGTAMIRYGDYELEFVGARKESYREDSRNPIVEDGTLGDDSTDEILRSMLWRLA
jgi:tRNA nucleotidyltransferase/poly(A) polymerase